MEMSTKDQAIPMAKSGIPPRIIAVKLNCTPQTIYSILREARQSGHQIAKFGGNGRSSSISTHVAISKVLARELAPHAKRRGVSVKVLAQRLLVTIADADLVDAVLDDTEWLKEALTGGEIEDA